jgi:hypothetical protein
MCNSNTYNKECKDVIYQFAIHIARVQDVIYKCAIHIARVQDVIYEFDTYSKSSTTSNVIAIYEECMIYEYSML